MAASGSDQEVRQRQVLERLLSVALGKGSGKIARELMDRYGSLSAILERSVHAASDTPSGKLLKAVRELLEEALHADVINRPLVSTGENLINYLAFAMARLRVEEVRVLYLDSSNHLLRDMVLARGTVAEAPIYPREIVRHALELGATAFLLVHNHPSGNPRPSRSDIDTTRRLFRVSGDLDIVMHDHLIIAQAGWFSFREEGYLQ